MADANDSAAILAQVNDDLKNLGYISQATADRMRDAETGVKDFNTKMALGSKAVSSLADAGMAAASAMYKGEKGAAAFNSSIDSMAEAATAAGAVLTLMIPGGVIVKALVAGMTLAVGAVAKYTKAANEMSDKLYTTFQKMSKSGAAASDGLMGIYGDMQKLGLGIQDLDGYVDMINASSRDLALFGGSVFAGRKAFADIGAAMTPFREQLYNAGLSQEQVNAGAMSYLKLQTQLGQAQKMTTSELAVGAKKYLIEMDALSKITGETRENNEKALEEVRSQERFRAHIEDLVAQGRTTEAKEVETTYLRLRVFNKALAQGFADIQGGDMTTKASQAALMSTQGEIITQSHRLAQGLSNSTQAFQGIGRAAGDTAETLRPLAKFGVYNQTFSDFAGDVELGRAARLDMAEVDKKVAEEQERQGVTGKKAADALQQAQTDLRSAQLKAMQAAQDFVSKGMLPATEAAIKMAGATESAATGLNNFMDGLTKLTKWLFGWLQGEEARAKTKEEIVADEKAAAAKTKYDKAFAGVPGGNMAQRELGIGATAEQKAALEAHKEAQRAAVQARKDADKKYGTTKESAAKAGMPSSGTTAAPAGAPSGGQPSTGTAPAPAPVSGGITAQDLAGAGLNIRGYGDVQAAGQAVSPALIELAKKIQNSVEGFHYFSGFNDKYHHENKPSSEHTKGLAADFVLKEGTYTPKLGQEIVSQLKGLGASKVLDEYKNPSDHATGKHFHVEIPKFGDGGISPGPQLAMVGEKGPEAHVPLKGGSIPVTIDLDSQADNKKNQLLKDNTKALLDMAASVTAGPRDIKISITDVENQPNNGKKTTDIDSVLDSMETALKNQEAARKQNVSISLKDATFGANMFGTGNDFTGPQMGGLTTDMAALKDIAAKLGAYDAQNEIITNPNTWKDIIKSGMLQNYDVGMANIGSRMIGDDVGNILGERVKEVMESNKVDVNTALTQTAKEFKDAMLQIVTQMQQQKDPELQAQMVEHLAAISRSGASTATASQRLAQVASN
jgi:hypothetical protein